MPTILLVEDDEWLRATLVRGLSRYFGTTVRGVASVGEAVGSIKDRAPDVIVCDFCLPDRPGTALMSEVDLLGNRVPMIFVSGNVDESMVFQPQSHPVWILSKPVALSTLCAHIEQAVSAPGNDSGYQLRDHLRVLVSVRDTAELTIYSGAWMVGRISVVNGVLWTATQGESVGNPALSRLLGCDDCRVLRRELVEIPGPQNVMGHWWELLGERSSGVRSLSSRV